MRIRVVDRQRRLVASKAALRALARAVFAGNEAAYDELGLTLVEDSAMRRMNRDFRGLERTTDVLSFDLRASRLGAEPLAGEIVISTDRVLAQAPRYRLTAGQELARLIVHGALHLLGHDHRREAERRRMRAAERAALRRAAPWVPRILARIQP